MLPDLSKRLSRYKLPLTAALVAAAALVRVAFLGELGPRIPYVTFFPAIMAAALLFGLGAGLWATLLSAAGAVAIQSVGGDILPSWPDRMGLVVFLAGGCMSTWLAHALSRANLAAAKAEAEAKLARESSEAAEKLVASRRDLAKAQALTHLGNWTWETSTDSVEWSDELFNICGVSREGFSPTPDSIAGLVHPEDLHLQQRWLKHALKGMEVLPFDCRIVRPSGEIRHVRVFGETVPDPERPDRAARLFGTVLDVTDTWRARDALKASEERFGSLFESAPIGIFRSDPDGRILEANPAMARMFGYASPDEFLATGPTFAGLARDKEASAARLARVPAETGWTSWEERFQHACGARITAALKMRSLPGRDGQAACLEGMVEDITESRDMLDALIESEGRFRAIFDRCPLAILVADPETRRFAMANQGATGLLGYEHQELLGMSVDFIHPPEALPMALAQFEDFARGPMGMSTPLPVLRKDGSVRHVVVNVAHVEIGGRVLLMGFFTDLTAQIHAERELGASESKYRELYQSMLDGYAKVDMEGRILECNGAFRNMLGYSDRELAALTYQDITPARWHPMELEILAGQVLERGYSDVYEKEYVRADGTIFPVELRTYLLRGDDGRPSGMWAIVRDVTPRKMADEETGKVMSALKEATRAKSDFLANMSHEIRTPLSAILGLTDLCLRMADPAKTAANLRMIRDSARLLSSIVGDVLDISRIEAGRLVLEDAPFKPRPLVDGILDAERLTLGGKDIALSTDIAPDVPESLFGDEVRLGQVLGNLVGNAVKFTSQGVIEVSAAVSGRPAPGKIEILFTVRDTGIGIPHSQQAIIFDSFRQADLSYAKFHQGVGLGLAICRELTGLMGGRIWVESEPGKGSAFSFTAVFGLSAPQAARPDAQASQPAAYALDSRPAAILVAEDNPYNRHVFTEFLASVGHAVEAAGDGREALDRLAAGRFDLVLMDVQMPGLDGLEAVRRLRAGECGPEAARLPVIALTAYAMAGDRERFLEAGMTDYLSKPVNLDHLAQAVARHTGKHGRTPTSPGGNPMAPLMAEAVAYVRQRLDDAGRALEASDLKTAAMAGHDVKGTAMGLALEPLTEPATLFEKACRAGDALMAGKLLGSLRLVLESLESEYSGHPGA